MKLLTLIFLFFIIIGCKDTDDIKTTKKNKGKINFTFLGEIKDTLIIPNIKYAQYSPVITFITKENPYIDQVIVMDSNTKLDSLEINFDEIILRHQYRLENIYYLFNSGDSIIYTSIKNDFPKYHVYNKEKNKKYMDNDYAILKEKVLGKIKPRDFMFFEFSEISPSKENPDDMVMKYLTRLNSQYNLESKFLDSLYHKNMLSEAFYILQTQKIRFDLYNFSISTYEGDEYYIDNKDLLLNELQNDSLVKYYFFKEFLQRVSFLEYSKGGEIKEHDVLEQYNHVKKSELFLPQSKRYLMHNLLKQIANEKSTLDFESKFQEFSLLKESEVLISDIKERYLTDFSTIKKATDSVYLITTDKIKTNLKRLIEVHKEKVIYIDFWASWCAPCRAAMPASKKLQEKYKDKEVVFIYISIDRNFNDWINASKEEGLLLNKNSILGVNYPSAKFYKELKLKSIPRYILYDKKGNLVHQNAPEPSSGIEITELLDKYLLK
ncbi:thiol-disulfide isomerase-like thioredoxin [Galbibacter orientalis DSM 19592]|uniref:Thiol-disulfide isomerase-like thioredoxin n=1 Tax=Galbibacter orientalis DSM 19592 TaxID=926559 RepID=I3C9G5_9FLAO|nr:TlpA disulfide reductase family protein [Galbibacter orientalis]EIJ40258.1 thiol-disulfide isomerase-like thioredoxin [Galbibacter orientalis DSM 19592]